ncbi:MAG: hypothetical protein U1E97_11210 [Alphaproteobacteria bacterium]
MGVALAALADGLADGRAAAFIVTLDADCDAGLDGVLETGLVAGLDAILAAGFAFCPAVALPGAPAALATGFAAGFPVRTADLDFPLTATFIAASRMVAALRHTKGKAMHGRWPPLDRRGFTPNITPAVLEPPAVNKK